MRNIELKARLHDWAGAIEACRGLKAASQGAIRQRDTYFPVPAGRLKLRESDPGDDYLVFYRRPDVAAAKGCDYEIRVVDRALRPLLEQALGVLAVVEKTRTLYLWENVRIHLDDVQGLGRFLEFEAVLSQGHSEADGFAKLARLRQVFGVADSDCFEGSYVDMTAGQGGRAPGSC